jgi:hypoxanthine phosphoribosyltransferase
VGDDPDPLKGGGMQHEDLAEILIDEATVQARVAELGVRISREYAGKTPLLICVLKGGVAFLVDLMRRLTVSHEIDFMAISSYGGRRTESSGVVQIVMDLSASIEGRHVLIVEDIIDSGRTLDYMLRMLRTRNPASLRVCVLLTKPSRREIDVPLDYVGFEIPDKFVVGYGLDYDERYRNLPFVGVLKAALHE